MVWATLFFKILFKHSGDCLVNLEMCEFFSEQIKHFKMNRSKRLELYLILQNYSSFQFFLIVFLQTGKLMIPVTLKTLDIIISQHFLTNVKQCNILSHDLILYKQTRLIK